MAITLSTNIAFTGLSNLVLYVKLYATNTSNEPSNMVNSFMTETLGFGDTKKFNWSEIPTVQNYSPTSSVTTVSLPTAGEEILKITDRKMIPSSYTELLLREAFTTESGMNQFIGYLLSQMQSAQTNHLYDLICTQLAAINLPVATQTIQVPQLPVSTTDLSLALQTELWNAKQIAKTIQLTLRDITVFNTKFNELGNTQALAISDMRTIWYEPYYTDNVMNLMATLLRSNVIDEQFMKTSNLVIPQSKSKESGTIGYIMHNYAFQVFYKFVFMGTFFDPSNLMINNFLHFHFGYGRLKNLPIVRLVASTPTRSIPKK